MTTTTPTETASTLTTMGWAMCKAALTNGVEVNRAWVREIVKHDRLMLASQCRVYATAEEVDAAVASIMKRLADFVGQ